MELLQYFALSHQYAMCTLWALPKSMIYPLRWRHNEHDSVSNHQPHDCLLNRLFRRRSKKTSKLRVTGLCPGNSPGTGEFPAQMASNAENVTIWWRHHAHVYDHNSGLYTGIIFLLHYLGDINPCPMTMKPFFFLNFFQFLFEPFHCSLPWLPASQS